MIQESVTGRDNESTCNTVTNLRVRKDKLKCRGRPRSTPRPASRRVVATTLGASISSAFLITVGLIPIAARLEKL